MFCTAFGLAMDYEVFLVSRIREYWRASGRARVDGRGVAWRDRGAASKVIGRSVVAAISASSRPEERSEHLLAPHNTCGVERLRR